MDDLPRALVTPLGLLLFVALPEELVFRGLMQNLLTRQLQKPWLAIAISAVVFGSTHYNNTASPDWRYLTLASVAGVFYGIAYRRSRSILVPALVHTLVDTVWILFFHSPTV
jgi:membrane protease YdiL (CAAX protease family)